MRFASGSHREVNDVWSIGAGGSDVGATISIEIPNSKTVDCAFVVAKHHWDEVSSRAIVEVNNRSRLNIANYNVNHPIEIYVTQCQCIRRDFRFREGHRSREGHPRLTKIDEGTMLLINSDNVHQSVAVEVSCLRHSNGCIRWAKGNVFAEITFAIVQVDIALPTIAMRHDEID